MLLGSFYTGLSGLQSNSVALNIAGNNLANINTTGFKRSQGNFSQIMSNTIRGISGAGNPKQIGLGTDTSEIVAKFEQGSIQATGIKTHMAIQGEGFFQVSTNGINSYTRSGNFTFNQEGFLTASNGARVQGFVGTQADGTVDTSGGIQDMRVDLGQASPPRPTDRVRFVTNLNAEAIPGEEYSTSIEVFDSKGVPHQLSITYTKNAADGRWDYAFSFPDGTPSATFPTNVDGFIEFDANGDLATIDGQDVNTPAIPDLRNRRIRFTDVSGGAEDFEFTWEPVDISTSPSRPFVTNYGSTYSTGTLFQDGFGSGVLQDIDFDQDGTMIGFFDNGLSLELGRIAVATFNNKSGLKQLDGNFYFATAASGPASVDGEGTGGKGSIISSSLESSNVDIAEEFTTLIIHQRGYQSNSRTITTTDQLMQEAINIKR